LDDAAVVDRDHERSERHALELGDDRIEQLAARLTPRLGLIGDG
jgi:hypothetical protein